MTLEQISELSQAVAAVAVIASLVFVGVQMRMNSEQAKQANILARIDIGERVAANFRDIVSQLMDGELAAIFRKVMFDHVEPTPVESTQILTYLNMCLSAHQSAFYAMREGLIEKDLLEAFVQNSAWYLTAPLFAREWRRVRQLGIFSANFADYLNGRFVELHPEQGVASDP